MACLEPFLEVMALYVSSMSQSNPRTQRRAESLPLIMPHSKSL